MRCIDIPARADDYVDRHLPLRERGAVAMHLVLCGDCRRYVQGLRTTKRFVAESMRRDGEADVAAAVARLTGGGLARD